MSTQTSEEATIHRRFESIRLRTPMAPAFRHDGTSVTYADVAARARAVSVRLGVAVDGTAGVCVVLLADNPVAETAAILGVMALGGVAVPVEAHQPAFRVKQIVRHCEPRAILACGPQVALSREVAPEAVSIEIPECSTLDVAPLVRVSADAPAYICYTSGSSGEPKGVVITHRQVCARTDAAAAALDFRATDRHTLLPSLGTGHGLSTVWRALLTGGMLLPLRVRNHGIARLLEWLNLEGATIFACSATLFRTFAAQLRPSDRLESVRLLRLGGERVTPTDFALFKRHCTPRAVFVNAYSCSEASTITLHLLTAAAEVEGDSVPIGRALPGCSVRLLDEDGAEVPLGEPGEIVVEGSIVASGYWREPERSASVFQPVPGDATARRLRTGDLAYRRPDGMLVHLGRRDSRVKIRGFRVELEGVETMLSDAPGVRQAAVFVTHTGSDETSLVALVIADRDGVDEKFLRAFATAHLPVGSVPHRFVLVDALPLGPSGKLDRARLPAVAELALANEAAVAASDGSAVEREVAAIWHEVLGHQRFGLQDDFVTAGGDSLRAMRVLTRVQQRFAVEIALKDFLLSPTVSALAAALEKGSREQSSVVEAELLALLDELESGRSDGFGRIG
jgi:amino acid adenylation domain-containing protein